MKIIIRSTPIYQKSISEFQTHCEVCETEFNITETIQSFDVPYECDYYAYVLQPNQYRKYHSIYERMLIKHYWCDSCAYRNCEHCGKKEPVRSVWESPFNCETCKKELWTTEFLKRCEHYITPEDADDISTEFLRQLIMLRGVGIGVYKMTRTVLVRTLMDSNKR